MNRNGNIVSMRLKSSVDSVQERFFILLLVRKENLIMGLLFALLDGVL